MRNRRLSELIQRKETLVRRLKEMLGEVDAERRSIRKEEGRIIADASTTGGRLTH